MPEIRVQAQRLAEMGLAFVPPPLPQQGHSQVEVGLEVFRVQFQRLLIMRNGLLQFVLRPQRIAEIALRSRITWF